jgi:hypothetical protein
MILQMSETWRGNNCRQQHFCSLSVTLSHLPSLCWHQSPPFLDTGIILNIVNLYEFVSWTPSLRNKIGKENSLEYTDIPKVFFTPHLVGHCCTDVTQGDCCALGHSCINVAWSCAMVHSYRNVIWGHCATVCSNNYLSSHCCATMALWYAGCLPL